MRTRHLIAAVAASLMLVVAVGCSSSKTADPVPNTLGPESSLPGQDGYTCDDPTGDIGTEDLHRSLARHGTGPN